MFHKKKQHVSNKKVALLSGFFCLCVFFSPAVTQAQTSELEAEYRATLFLLIDRLLEQIAVLQAQLEEQKRVEVDRPGIISSGVTVSKRYQISGEGSVDSIADSSHRTYLQRVYEIFPSKYDAKLAEFLIFEDPNQGFDAFVETLPPTHSKWAYAVNSDVIDEVDTEYTTELIVHELAHVLSYDEILGVPSSAIAECRAYFKKNGCPKDNSYIIAFADAFWTTADLNRTTRFLTQSKPSEAAYDYYDFHADQYVSGYAALSPEEDFAESFAAYVTDSEVKRNTLSSQKTWWFDQFVELREVKASIR